MRRVFLAAVFIFLCSCGGGGSGGGSSLPAPSGLSYPSPQVFVAGHGITTLTPTVTGTVSSYAVNPALPAGLSLSASTGQISGTPTTATPTATYTVTASNSSGSTSAGLSITVNNDVAPSITYERTDFAFTAGVPVAAITPSNSGGTVVTWSIHPALPAGLTFNTANGSIGGTPTVVTAPDTYVVRAANSGGVTSVTLSVVVESGVLLDLSDVSHGGQITTLRYNGTRVLSQDSDGHWLLWDAQTALSLANGDSTCSVSNCNGQQPGGDLAGPTFVIRTLNGLEFRSSANGQLLATVSESISWWKLASDGSYICAGGPSGLTAWSRTGAVLLSRSGDYSSATAFATPTEIRVAGSPAAFSRIETIRVVNGSSATSAAYQGGFHSWFTDGERFLTNVGTTVRVYSKDAVEQDLKVVPSIQELTGQGSWFWIYNQPPLVVPQVEIYAVGASASPAASYALPGRRFASGLTIGILSFNRPISVIDLSGSAPSRTDYANVDSDDYNLGTQYAAISSSQWFVGHAGVLLDGSSLSSTPRYLGSGAVVSIAGGSGHIAVATKSGPILYFDADTMALEGQIAFPSSKVALSADGTVLVAAASTAIGQTDRSLRVYSLPSGAFVHVWPYTSLNYPDLDDFSLSGSGQVLGRVVFNGPLDYVREVTATVGGPLIWSDSGRTEPIRLSPDGTLISAPTGVPFPSTATHIFRNGSLLTVLQGYGAGWIDNNRLLLHRFRSNGSPNPVYDGSYIVDINGQEQRAPALVLYDFQVVSTDSVYSPRVNTIYSLTSGNELWSSPNSDRDIGAIAGRHVIFASGALVRAEPYQ